jgi:hypothetical protein
MAEKKNTASALDIPREARARLLPPARRWASQR